MSKALLNFSVTLTSVQCFKCSGVFAMPDEYDRRLQRDPNLWFWCPMCGCHQHYTGKSWEEQLADARAETERVRKAGEEALQRETKRKEWAVQQAKLQERRARTQKGLVTRLKNRVAKGSCPCCGKDFPDMALHMTEKHPDYAAEKAHAGT